MSQASSKSQKNKEDSGLNYRKISLNDDADKDETKSTKNMSRGEINLHENETVFMASVFKVGCQFIILQGTKAFASMIACTILCRHLMVWKIFAPRFIYEGIATYVSFVAILVGFLLVMRVHKSVKSLISKLIV
jgi:phosphatidylinositol glycan class O